MERPRVYATARRAARAGTFGRRNLAGWHAYNHLDLENQPVPGGATQALTSSPDKENSARRSAPTTSLLSEQSVSRSPSEERDEEVILPGLNTPYQYSGSLSPTSPPYYPETPEPAPQTPRERSVTRSIKSESPAPQTPRERSLTRSIKQEPSEPFSFSSPTTSPPRANTTYNHSTDSIPTKPLPRPQQASPSTSAELKRPLSDPHNFEDIANLPGLFCPTDVNGVAGPSIKHRRVNDAEPSPAPSSSPPLPRRLLRPARRDLLGELTFAESSPKAGSSLPARRLVRPVNRVPLGELRFEEMPKKASTAGKRKRSSVPSAPSVRAEKQSSQKRVRRGEQVMEETVRVLVPASSAPAEEGEVGDEEGSAREEERVIATQSAWKPTRKSAADASAGQAATTNPKGKQDADINVDLERMNNVLQGATPATSHHQNASPASEPTYDAYEFYDYDAEFNIRCKVDSLSENIAHLVEQSRGIRGACTAMASQIEGLRKSQKSLDGKLTRASKAIETSEIGPEVKQELRRKLGKEAGTIGDSLLRVEGAIGAMVKTVVGARKWAEKVRWERAREEEEESSSDFEMAKGKANTQRQGRRPGPPKGSKPTPFEPRASQEEVIRNLKEIGNYYVLLSRSIMEKEMELGRRAPASQKTELGKRRAQAHRYDQTPERTENARSERTRMVGREREKEELLEWWGLGHGAEKVQEGSPEVSVKDREVDEDEEYEEYEEYEENEEYEDEVDKNSPPRALRKLPPSAPLPRRRLGDGLVPAATPPAKAPAPVRLGSDAPTERVRIPAFGTRHGPRAHTPSQSNNVDEWSLPQMEALFDGVKLFGRIGPRKWAQAVKHWDETGGKGKGRAGEGREGGKRAMKEKSVEEIERKGKEVAMSFAEAGGVGEWMEPWTRIL